MATYRISSPVAVEYLVEHGFTVVGPGALRRAYHPIYCCGDCSPGAPQRPLVARQTTVVKAPPGVTRKESHWLVYTIIRLRSSVTPGDIWQ
jgi:hypothetical protein